MINGKRPKTIGRKERGSFLLLPHDVINHENFFGLSPRATKLLIQIAGQYKGTNNGDLATTWKLMSVLGWCSKDQLYKAREELLVKGWIVLTRQGRRPNIPSLFAITWQPIDECQGKLERPTTRKALGYWKTGVNPEYTLKLECDVRGTGHRSPSHGGLKGTLRPVDVRHTGHREQKCAILTSATRAPSKNYTKGDNDSWENHIKEAVAQ